MKFNFKARDREGALKEGTIEAVDNALAIDLLQKNGLFPLSVIAERADNSFSKTILKYFDRVTSKELVIFFRQLSILIEAKVPIITALSAMKDQTENKYLQRIISEMINDIQDGMPLGDALKKHPDVFSNLSVNIIKSGESSGNLKRSVEYVADNIEKSYTLLQKVKSAMMYPIIVIIVFFIIAFLVMTFVIPKLTVMIKEMGDAATIPWYTKVIIGLSDFMASYWWAIAVIILGLVGSGLYYVKTPDGKREWDQIKIKLPIFGSVFTAVYIARFADNLSVLLAGGVPIIRALTIVSSVIDNVVYEKIFLRAADEVKVGGNMSDALKKFPEIPPIVSQMIKIGEESGQIDLVLNHIARFYEQEADAVTKNLSTLIEPILMVIIGAGVGFLAVSVLMPIYNIAGQLQ